MLDIPISYFWLLPLGLLIGAFGTLIGAGGGFLLVPILLILYPDENTELITSISLAVVFFNALSGSWAYSRMRRIDYKSGVIFAAATIPGAILGALFGVIMILAGIFLWIAAKDDHSPGLGSQTQPSSAVKAKRLVVRDFVDAAGIRYHYSYNPAIGIVLSVFVGFISSLLGVGGGFIHVPALTRLLNFPVHVATATSHFILTVMALTGTAVHLARGVFVHGARRTAILAVGVILGAQLGAYMSTRLGGKVIIRGLALAMIFVGIRLILTEI